MPSVVDDKILPDNQKLSANEPIPVVIVEGFLGGVAGTLLWGQFEDYLNLGCTRKRRAIFARCVIIEYLTIWNRLTR